MAIIITKQNCAESGLMLDKIYRFRCQYFVEKMKWQDLCVVDGREIDRFDTPEAVHIVGLEGEHVQFYGRLLPTTGPHLLSDLFPEIMQGAEAPKGSDIWEYTRATLVPRRAVGTNAFNPEAGLITAATIETCLHLGIKALLIETHPFLMKRLSDSGFEVSPLAPPTEYRGHPLVPLYAGVTSATLATTRAIYGLTGPILELDERARVDEPRRLAS